MRPLTNILPKAMAPFNEDTLIGNSLSMLNKCVKYVHVTVGHKKAMLSEYLMDKGVNSIFNTEGRGNGWWLSNTLIKYLDEPLLVLTTDNITEIDIHFLEREYNRLGNPPCMLVPVKPITGIDGDFIEHENGIVKSIQRQKPKDIYCSGIQVLNPLDMQKYTDGNDDFKSIWSGLIKIGKLTTSEIYPKIWFSIDTLENLAKAQMYKV
jgi:NDP-sugar pyrophosphorylase family protein